MRKAAELRGLWEPSATMAKAAAAQLVYRQVLMGRG